MKKVVIDARMYGSKHAGIGRYVKNLIQNLSLEKEIEFILLVRKDDQQQIKNELGSKKFKLVIAEARHYSLKEQIILPIVLNKINPDLFHVPHFNAPIFWFGKTVVTVHDMIMHYSTGLQTTTRSKFLYWPKQLLYRLVFYLAVKKAQKIIVPSNFWKKKLRDRYGFKSEKIAVTYEGADEWQELRPNKSLVIKARNPFAVYTGSAYPHKNLERLFLAVKILNEEQKTPFDLYVSSGRSVFLKRLEKLSQSLRVWGYVRFLGFVDDQDLAAYYQKAVCLVQPSLLEGFGLTGLEAMMIGCPVLAADASCLPEVYESAALYFDPHDSQEMAEKIKTLVNNPELREKLRQLGFAQAKKYSWQKMAKETLSLYLNLLKE